MPQAVDVLPTLDPAAQGKPVHARDPFVANLLLLLVFGVALSGWLLTYTDWFPEFGGLLALGGLFSWLGVVSKLLTDERMDALQKRVDRALFGSRGFRWYTVGALVGLVAVASFIGTVEVRSQGDFLSRLVWVDFDPARADYGERLPVAGRVRQPLFSALWRPARTRVKVSGYPSLVVPVHPWHRHELAVPASFLSKPVVLLTPSMRLAGFRQGLTLVAKINGTNYRLPFEGHAVWIGCEDDVAIPARLLEEWRATKDPSLLPSLGFPGAITVDLTAGSKIHVSLVKADGTTFKGFAIAVRAAQRPEDFPQVEEINVPGE